MAYQE